ncbi:MAG: pyridoxal phosphate-dependent decarboxylase family protein, partial [Longimicrobiales bacterium]
MHTSDEHRSAQATDGDMEPEVFRRFGHAVIDRIAEYLKNPERWPVLPSVQPGEVAASLPASAPARGEPFERILEDYDRLIVPATTHWNHPGFLAYFAITGSAAGILGEALAAALNVNAMLWRTGPAATELEEVTLSWLRQLLGLPVGFDGTINDTASSSTLYALAAAREADAVLGIREHGLAGRADVPPLRVYCSEEAHSSVDKAVLTLGLGLRGVRRIGTDTELRLDPVALEAAIAEDRAAGVRPLAVVATVGTTSTTAVDPVPAIGEICAREGVWLHVDAAYGG